jgi:hypothetical protein
MKQSGVSKEVYARTLLARTMIKSAPRKFVFVGRP